MHVNYQAWNYMKKILRVTKTTRLLKIREILADMFADVSDEALLEQYSLSWEQLEKIYSKLFYAGFLTAEDLEKRIDLRAGKDASHIPLADIYGDKALYECVICGYISHLHFSACPRCRQINLRRLTRRSFGSDVVWQHAGHVAG
jgi:hypothetical protein